MLYVFVSYILSPLIYLLIAFKKNKHIKKILVIQIAKIGDLICSTPVFREIKAKYPEASLDVMINPITKELLEENPHVDKIIIIKIEDVRGISGKLRLSKMIRKGNYDISIMLNPSVPFVIASFWGLAPRRLAIMPDFSGMTFKLASPFVTSFEKHRPGRLVIETYLKLLKNIQINTSNISKEVYKSEASERIAKEILGDADKPLVGMAVASGKKIKELASGKVAEIINYILSRLDVRFILIGSAQDYGLSKQVLDSIEEKNKIINATGKLNLKELPALVERLSLFIGVDTGVLYMADALSIPVIDIAGPANMNDQRPTGRDSVIIRKNLDCAPCSFVFKAPSVCETGTKECVKNISPEEIFNAAVSILS